MSRAAPSCLRGRSHLDTPMRLGHHELWDRCPAPQLLLLRACARFRGIPGYAGSVDRGWVNGLSGHGRALVTGRFQYQKRGIGCPTNRIIASSTQPSLHSLHHESTGAGRQARALSLSDWQPGKPRESVFARDRHKQPQQQPAIPVGRGQVDGRTTGGRLDRREAGYESLSTAPEENASRPV